MNNNITSNKYLIHFGVLYTSLPIDLSLQIEKAIQQNIDFICIPLYFNDSSTSQIRIDEKQMKNCQCIEAQVSQDKLKSLMSLVQTENFTFTSPKQDYKTIKKQVGYAIYLGFHSVIIEIPQNIKHLEMFSNFLRKIIFKHKSEIQFLLLMPYSDQSWHFLQRIYQYSGHISFGICLEISDQAQFPSFETQQKFNSQDIKFIVIESYAINKKSQIQNLCKEKFINKQKYDFIIQNKSSNINWDQINSAKQFLQSSHDEIQPLSQLQSSIQATRNEIYDPLRPNAQTLKSQTYQIFEEDTEKYNKYYEACISIFAALKELQNRELIILLVGAGRGAILEKIYKAADAVKLINFQVVAIDKNEYALYLLQDRFKDKSNLRVIQNNIFKLKEKQIQADLIISEMLGGFGCNEFSPEIMAYSEKKFLNAGGICIPKQYSSFLVPVYAPIILNKITQMNQNNGKWQEHEGNFQVPYSANLANYYIPQNIQPQKCFTFDHPNPNIDIIMQCNQKQILNFPFDEDCLISGFIGYFQCFLTDDVHFSNSLHENTQNILGWFPLFFPFKERCFMQQNQVLEINVERISKQKQHNAYYQWRFKIKEGEKLIYVSDVYNENGQFYQMCQK